MEVDRDYLEYSGQASLALLAISAAYFFDLGRPITYGVLLLIPLLYGYTAFISREKFRPATLLSLVTLIFAPLNILMGFIAVFIPISNILISFFAGGTGFRNYSNATLLPMLFTGLILGSIAFGAAQTQPEIRQEIVSSAEDISGKQTSILMEQSQLKELQGNATQDLVQVTSENTIVLTQAYVLNNTELNLQDQRDVRQAFEGARDEIPDRLTKRMAEQSQSLDVSDQASTAVGNIIEANLGIIIALMALSFYIINPLISILTAFSALAFEKLNEQL